MGSLIDFQDLNLYPDTTPTTTTATTTIIPKIEPKLEPLDEPLNPPLSNSPHPPPNHTHLVYSEFNRISNLFHSSFNTQTTQNSDDVIESDDDLTTLENNNEEDPDSRALVPVPDQTQLAISRPKPNKRSSELVRVTDLSPDDHQYFRDTVRKTRMAYDSLRIFAVFQDEKKDAFIFTRTTNSPRRVRVRGDLVAASVMRDCGLWLYRDKRIVGSIPGIEIGDLFFFRMELCVIGLHGQTQAGIDFVPANQSSNKEPIATSVIVSGGYEDDEDSGDVIIYTGHGGQDKHFKQCVNQKLEGGNLALERSMNYGIEVRVIRGFKYEGSVSGKVYVYDGLYRVVGCWFDVGKSGFGVYKFKLVRIENQAELGSVVLRLAANIRNNPLAVRPVGYFSFDISMKKENVPVFLFNDIDNDHEPGFYEYIVSSVFPSYVYQNVGNGSGCECVARCVDDCFCALRNGGEFAYDQNGILVRGKPLVFECGPHCRCPPSCRNRVCQKGVRNRFEVFRSRETGWGVRSLDLIKAGAFICEYAGVVLTREQAQLFTMNGDSLVYPNRFAERWAEWGDLSQIFSDYTRPEYPSIPPLDFAMDVSRMRNVACYMSHSLCPNVLVQFVLYDHNSVSFPHLMLFAMENIPPLRELSLDYGVADEWTGKLRICN